MQKTQPNKILTDYVSSIDDDFYSKLVMKHMKEARELAKTLPDAKYQLSLLDEIEKNPKSFFFCGI